MSKYICPICGTAYENVNDVAKCVEKCAKMVNAAKEFEKTRINEMAELQKDLAIKKTNVDKAYNNLKAEIEKYNDVANKIKKIDNKFDAHCSTSISFNSNTTTNKINIGKPRLRTLDELEDITLNELVDKFLEIF